MSAGPAQQPAFEPAEPLAPRWARDPERPGVRRFEITSGGDRVSGRLVVPEAPAQPAPLVLVVGDGADGTNDAAAFTRAGLAAAFLDAPLRGARRSPKWSERLDAVLAGGPRAPGDALLFASFRDQGVRDLGRVADAAAGVPGVAVRRVGVAARGAGAWPGALWLSADPRAAAAVLAPGPADPAWDPADVLAARPARPLLLLHAGPEARARTEAWHAAAAAPREIAALDADEPWAAAAARFMAASGALR